MLDIRRYILPLLIAIGGLPLPAAQAQRHHHHHGPHHRGHSSPYSQPDGYWSTPSYPSYVSPVVGGGGYYPLPAGDGFHGHHHRIHAPVFVSAGPIWFPNPVAVTPQLPIMPTVSIAPVVFPTPNVQVNDPSKLPAKPSTAAGKVKSLDHQVHGDEKLRQGLWALAYMRYRSAVDTAGDRGEARLRIGFCYTAMKHYSSAVREFKRGLFLNPELAATGIRLPMLFGPGSEIVRTSILNKVAEWVREDNQDSDRWFLLGIILHYENDPRSLDALNAARQTAGGNEDHIRALLSSPLEKPPAPPDLVEGKPAMLMEFPPLPNVGQALPAANLPNGLPPLNDQPMPPIAAPAR